MDDSRSADLDTNADTENGSTALLPLPAHWRDSPSPTLPMTSSPTYQQQIVAATNKRFTSFVSNQELSVLSKGLVVPNTNKTTLWAIKNFEAWRDAQNISCPQDPIPENVLTKEVLNHTLSKYVLETRKTSGEPYPPKTLHQLMCGLLRHMQSINPRCPNFLNKKDTDFQSLHGAMDVPFAFRWCWD